MAHQKDLEIDQSKIIFPFLANAPILYPLKKLENLFSRSIKMETLARNVLKYLIGEISAGKIFRQENLGHLAKILSLFPKV